MSLDVVYLAWNRLEFTQISFELLLKNTDWSLVDRLLVFEDGSTDGTREYLDQRIGECPVPSHLAHLGWGSPVKTMNYYLSDEPADLFAKIDNDIAVPPGWLGALVGVMAAHPELELLGMEAGFTRLPGRGGEPWDGTYDYKRCRHIGGVGLMRAEAFLSRPRPRPRGRFGFTEWQHHEDPVRGWIEPDLLVPQLDRLAFEPFVSLSRRYVDEGWQREWPTMDPAYGGPYYYWLFPEKEPA